MDDIPKKFNSIKKYERHKNKNKDKIPHNSKLNNLKSNKYFTINTDENSMKRALTKYREKNYNTININNENKTHQSNITSTEYSQLYPIKTKLHKNASFKLDKKLLDYAEPRTKVKEFHKIQPKIIDSFIIDIESLNSFFEEENNEKNNIEKNNKNENNNKNINKDNNVVQNKNNNKSNDINKKNIKNKRDTKIKKYKKENIVINLNNIDSNDNSKSIVNKNNIDIPTKKYENVSNTITNKENSKNKIKSNKENEFFLTEIKDKNELFHQLNIKDINFDYLLMMEKLYNELIKDIEINKMEIYQNKLSIIKDFLFIYNSQCNTNLYNIIDNMILNENNSILTNNTLTKNKSCNFKSKIKNDNIFLIIKEFFIEQFIFFYTIILIALVKKEKNNYHSGLHNLTFYFHQNIIVFIYIVFSNFNLNCEDKSNEVIFEKCMNILNENKTWLDKNNYKKYLQTNNKLSKQIIINLLTQIKLYFKTNPPKGIDGKYLETSINSLKSYLNIFPKRKIISILKEIKDSSSINSILESIKLNKIMSHYSEEKSKSKKTDESEVDEECNVGFLNESFPKPPFLKPLSPKYKYTLVLDLDETLVHYISDSDSAYIQIRPGAEEFIKDLSEYYEIVIFTAALKTYADLVIDGIDPDGAISDRLYRQHTVGVGNANIKDLDKLGRDIKHVIIIDNFLDNFSLQPKNGLNILDFEGNEYDDELNYLKNDLIKLVKLNPDDVRYYLKDIQIEMDKRAIYFQNLNNQNNYDNELMNENIIFEDNNNLFSEIINNETNSSDIKENNRHNHTDGSENIEE